MSSEASDPRPQPQSGDARGHEGYRGTLFVISSPSGGGKGTLIKQVLSTVPGIS